MKIDDFLHIDAAPATRHLAVEYRPIDGLVPYARNARTHSDEQIAEIAGSIREFGFTNPVLIAGHGRVMAARKLGMDELPAIVLTGLAGMPRGDSAWSKPSATSSMCFITSRSSGPSRAPF